MVVEQRVAKQMRGSQCGSREVRMSVVGKGGEREPKRNANEEGDLKNNTQKNSRRPKHVDRFGYS